MRVLHLTHSPAYNTPPSQGEAQIITGPNWADAQNPQSQSLSNKIPVGDFNITLPLNKLSTDQQSDAVKTPAYFSGRSQPRNPSYFSSKKILLLNEIEVQTETCRQAFNHTSREPYDRVLLLHPHMRVAS